MLADGLISITVPESIDPNDPEFGNTQAAMAKPNFGGSRGQQLGNPVAPSSGGQGEIIPQQVVQRNMLAAQTGLAKAAFNANQILSVLCSTVQKNLSQEEVGIWNECVDDYLLGRVQIEEEKLVEVLSDVCKKSSDVVGAQTWSKELSDAIAEKVLSDTSNEEISKRMYAQEGEDEEIEEKVKEEVESLKSDVQDFTRSKFVDELSKYVVLISKSDLLEGKLNVDSTERVGENINISREIAKEVLGNLSTIVQSAYEAGRQYLNERIGDTDAVS